MQTSLNALADCSTEALDGLLAAGQGPSAEALTDYLYRGLALRLPPPAFALAGKFGKSFVRDADGVRGWNTRMRQDGVDEAWTPATFGGRPITYGHYRVRPTDSRDPYPNALVIDYQGAGNRALDPLGRVIDYLVAVGGDDLLLGRMYLHLGGRLVPTRSYFALQRYLPVRIPIPPPCPPRR